MRDFIKRNKNQLLGLIPLSLILTYFFVKSLSFPLHDFSNSYFPAHIVFNDLKPEKTLFDIYDYNQYIWNLGYDQVLADFYLNSPFNALFFYPLTFIEDAFMAKHIFTIFSCFLFLLSIYVLGRQYDFKNRWLVILIPILCFVPIRNQILFGQTYFLIFSFVVFSYKLFDSNKKLHGVALLATATLLKVFPLFYGLPLIFNTQWKTIGFTILMSISLLIISFFVMGTSIWEIYFFEVLPNALKNESTVNFQYNAQSMDVFLKTLLVRDAYYNPFSVFDKEQLYYVFKWIFKSVVLGFAISLSISNKNKLFALISIWVVAVFLIQSRTATYAQILWLIPSFYMVFLPISFYRKAVFLTVLFFVCNIPISQLETLPIILRFSRLWLTLLLAILFYFNLKNSFKIKPILISLIVLFPLHLGMFSKSEDSNSDYVLKQKAHFMIFDFSEQNNRLIYNVLGKNGAETKRTDFVINSFDDTECAIIDNQIFFNGKQITNTPALKKKPVLVNDCDVLYLTDSRSRRGAFTIKKINICKTGS